MCAASAAIRSRSVAAYERESRRRYPNQPVERVQGMRQVIESSLAPRSYAAALMSAFALLALLLSGLGIYGVVAYVTQQRAREFAIRMALGARRGDVVRSVLRRGGGLVAGGLVVGVGLALLVARLLASQLFETRAGEPGVYVVCAVVLGVVGILACLVPAVRAARVEPRKALSG